MRENKFQVSSFWFQIDSDWRLAGEKKPSLLAPRGPSLIREGTTSSVPGGLFPVEEWTFSHADIHSRSRNTPMLGMTFTGRVRATISRNHWFIRN